MSCSANELTGAAILCLFVLAAVYSEWHAHALMAILKHRHGAVYASLGRPDPLLTGDSDKHGAALSIFLLSVRHAALGDAQLSRHVHLLRCGFAMSVTALVTLIACWIMSPDPKALVTLACWWTS